MIPRPLCRQGRLVSASFSITRIAASLGLALIAAGTARAQGPGPIAWRQDYSTAFEEARSSDRLLWIQFTGPWCPNCRRMERDAFPDPDVVQQARESFVPVKLRSDVNEELALAFNLSGLPATVIVAPNREVVSVQQGYLGPDELDNLLSRAHDGWEARSESLAKNDETARSGPGIEPNAPAARPDATTLGPKSRPNATKPALEGHCPVSLVADRRLVHGLAEHSLEHDGRIYRFASAAHLKRFQEAPEHYVPANQGDCPVTKLDGGANQPGSPRWGVLFQGRLFLCGSEEARQRFLQSPTHYAMVDVAEQGFCPHCLAENGLLVRGDPKYAVARDGHWYWFPDANHREWFLARANTSAKTSARIGDTSSALR